MIYGPRLPLVLCLALLILALAPQAASAVPLFGASSEFGAGATPISVASDDLNADGRPDLVVANFGDADVSVLLGNGDGSFGPKTARPR